MAGLKSRITLTDLSDGYTILLTNSSHVFAGDVSSALASSIQTQVIALKGGKLQIAKVGDITGLPSGMTATVSDNNTTAAKITFSATTSMASRQGVVTIPVTADGLLFNLTFSYALSLKGATGDTGATGPKGDTGATGPKGDTGSNGKDASQIKDNLLLNSNFGLKNLSSWNTWGNSTNSYNSDSTYGHCAKLALGTGRWKGIQQLYTAAKPNCRYTVSAMFCSASPDKSVCIGVHHRNNSTIKNQVWESKIIPQGNWYQLKLTFTTTSDTNSMLLMFGNDSESQTNFTMYVTNLKLEENSTATAWILNSSEFKGDKGATGNFTKRIPLYYVSTSTTAPAAPTKQVTATEAATTTTWTKGKYTTFAVGLYYYTCEQIETYNYAGTLQSYSWSSVSRDTEYENAGTAKLRAAGKYIGQKSAAFTAYTASSNWDWFLATKAFTVNSVSVTAGNVYVWNGSTWTKDTDTSHLAAAMNDMIALVDSYTTNETSVGAFATVFAKTIAAKAAFIKSLFAEKIIMQTNGIIRGGSRYNDAGAVADASKTGFWISANGTIKGNLQSDYLDSVILGTNAGKSLKDNSQSGQNKASVLIGTSAGAAMTTASMDTFIGTGAGASAKGSMNTFVGHWAGVGSGTANDTGEMNVAVGKSAGNAITKGSRNVYAGTAAGMLQKTSNDNTVVGDEAFLQSTDASGNVVIGSKAANLATLGDDNIIIGNRAAYPSKTWGSNNIAIGQSVNADSGSFIGLYSGDTTPSNTINIGKKFFYLPNFKKTGKAAFLFDGPLFEYTTKNSQVVWGALSGVVESSFEEWGGYIKYSNGFIIQWIKFVENADASSWQNLDLPANFTSKNSYVAVKMLNRPTNAGDTWAASYTAIPYDRNHVRTFKESSTSEISSIIAIGY